MKLLPQSRWQALILGISILGAFGLLYEVIGAQLGVVEPYMPHAHCYLFNRPLILLHGWSDMFIGFSYVAISATLVQLVFRARRELPFHWMMLAFAIFIVACGSTHFMEVWTLRAAHPQYWLAGDLKLITAMASVATAIFLPPLVPKILRLLAEAQLSAERKRKLEAAHEELGGLYQRVKQVDEMKTRFFANVSHELRTPLSLIIGPVDRLLENPAASEPLQTELQVIRRNAALLRRHVDDLLDLARLEAGKIHLHYARLDLVSVARFTLGLFSSSALRRVQLRLDAPERLIGEIDVEKIERVLINLLGNAVKFTPERGEVELRLREERGFAVFFVDDNGPGIAPEHRELIFERYHQSSAGSTTGGSGLGLAIVKEFVELHHGRVTVENTPLGGASFRVEIPLQAPADAIVEDRTDAAATAPRKGPSPVGREGLLAGQSVAENLAFSASAASGLNCSDSAAPQVLIIDDNAEMRGFIERSLRDSFRTTSVSSGHQALLAIAEEPPDLILTDMMMPGMTGEELLTAIRLQPDLANVPVLLLTARTDEALKARLLQSGAQDYLMKPFAVSELKARVQNLVSMKLTRDTLQSELSTQEHDLNRLANELALRARELLRAKEAAETANHARDRFLAMLSHELRTPLTPVLALAANLEQEANPPPDRWRDSLTIIRRNVELEARLIDDLLDLTRVSAGKLQLQRAVIDAHQTVCNAVEICQADIARKDLFLYLQMDAVRHHLYADSSRLQQALWNLLGNAVKFTPFGGKITVQTSNTPEGRLRIEVIDTGVGIPEDALGRVFEPFEQIDAERARRSGGLGLGLTVTRGIVEAHAGHLRASSDGPGEGSTFILEFETVDAPTVHPAIAVPIVAATLPMDGRRQRILLVEDHADTRQAVLRLMRGWGYQVEYAASVAEALEKALNFPFDILVSDVGLPDGSGPDLIRALRRERPRFPGVAISGYGMETDIQASRDAGFTAHLVKPLDAERLRATIEQALRESTSALAPV